MPLVNHDNVRSILRQRLLLLDDNGRELPAARAWENENFVPPDTGLWVRESYLPGDETQVATGMTECTGIYQVDVMCPSGSGTKEARRWANLLTNWFAPANSLSTTMDDGSIITVGIDRASQGASLQYNKVWVFVPVRITWRTYGLNTSTGLLAV